MNRKIDLYKIIITLYAIAVTFIVWTVPDQRDFSKEDLENQIEAKQEEINTLNMYLDDAYRRIENLEDDYRDLEKDYDSIASTTVYITSNSKTFHSNKNCTLIMPFETVVRADAADCIFRGYSHCLKCN